MPSIAGHGDPDDHGAAFEVAHQELARALLAKRHSYKRRPITDPAQVRAILQAARALSSEHWETVMILYTTGMDVRALANLTWREYLPGWLLWRRPRRRETLKIPLADRELERAVRGYTSRPRRTPDKIERLVHDVRRAANLDGLEDFSPMTLRMTRAWLMIQEGHSVERVARDLALSPAIVREAAAIPALSAEGLWPPAIEAMPAGL